MIKRIRYQGHEIIGSDGVYSVAQKIGFSVHKTLESAKYEIRRIKKQKG